ncbi:50S ribosomal protein L37e [Candidatus Woesearchaeota archaeon]|nr:50S ribosomal protein L37e [Candidatus Woesearchaeota archaeon]
MTKGTPSQGKRSGKKSHIYCRRCGKHTYHITKKRCSACGYGARTKLRKYKWSKKNSKA